jgi:hypothetical protein
MLKQVNFSNAPQEQPEHYPSPAQDVFGILFDCIVRVSYQKHCEISRATPFLSDRALELNQLDILCF